MKPSLGNNANEILDAFKNLDRKNCGRYITEAEIIGAGLRFRWQGATNNGRLGVVVGDICLRDATDAEYGELEESIELGQVEIYTTPRWHAHVVLTRSVVHQATGHPIDPNSPSAIRQRQRWDRLGLLHP